MDKKHALAAPPPLAHAPDGAWHKQPSTRLGLLALAAVFCMLLFMTIGVKGHWDFVLPLRARKLASLILVAYAIGVATVLFQTATNNRILTPAIMGFDALYVLIQSTLVFLLGSQQLLHANTQGLFIAQVIVMVAASGLLYKLMFSSGRHSLHQLVLTGVVLGMLFRSFSSFIQRVINPSEYAFIQDRFFASFNNPDETLLLLSALLILVTSIWGMRKLHAYDVLTLGRDTAINLGVDHKCMVSRILVIVAILTSVSTALVGPVTFFGLLVSHLAYTLVRTFRHALLLPAAFLIGVICLVGGQIVLEQLFSFDTNLRVVVDFLGGVTLIILLVRGSSR